MKIIAELKTIRGAIGLAMPSKEIHEASPNAKIVDALKGNPVYEIET